MFWQVSPGRHFTLAFDRHSASSLSGSWQHGVTCTCTKVPLACFAKTVGTEWAQALPTTILWTCIP